MAASVVYTNFGGQIVHENRGGTERQYVSDTLGSTIALTDSGTAVTDTWDYWPYGEVMSRTGTNPTPFTFVGTLGYFKDLLDKLLYVRARHFQPNYGRWLTATSFVCSRCGVDDGQEDRGQEQEGGQQWSQEEEDEVSWRKSTVITSFFFSGMSDNVVFLIAML